MSDIFCQIIETANSDQIEIENENFIAIFDKHPVSPGHLLIIPKRHIQFFELVMTEWTMLLPFLQQCKHMLDNRFHPDGYNIGVNDGQSAGQTIFHLHIHLIPRYKGDIEQPQGGVRGVIPERQKY